MTKNIYQFSCNDNKGNEINLNDFEGKVLLIVNTASQCGFTPQYEGLEKLQKLFPEDSFSVLAFPCNQFGGQEPGSNEEIVEFCRINYGTTFPVFSKIDVKGQDAHPLFEYLTQEKKGLLGTEGIKWNFTKFLVNKDGEVVKRFSPKDTEAVIEAQLVKSL